MNLRPLASKASKQPPLSLQLILGATAIGTLKPMAGSLGIAHPKAMPILVYPIGLLRKKLSEGFAVRTYNSPIKSGWL